MTSKPIAILGSLALAVCVAIILATGSGFVHIAPLEVIQILTVKLFGGVLPETIDTTFPFIITEVRLPRILCSVMVGGGLAVAGCVFQAILLNPLADPYTLGVSSGAAFGASLSLLLTLMGIALPPLLSLPLCAFIGAIFTLIIVFALASNGGKLSSNTLILSGVIIAAILSAGIGFIKYLADEQVGIIIFWLMGSFVSKSWPDVIAVTVLSCPTLLVILYFARDLNIMALGQRTAATLGVEIVAVRQILLICATLITAIGVSISGIIGFVGLIIPHLLRLITGPDNRVLVPACFLGGGLLLLLADTITRAFLPSEIPIGILTSLIGGPFFCYIFKKKQMGGRQ